MGDRGAAYRYDRLGAGYFGLQRSYAEFNQREIPAAHRAYDRRIFGSHELDRSHRFRDQRARCRGGGSRVERGAGDLGGARFDRCLVMGSSAATPVPASEYIQ
ncbi:hypothetical protein D3C77_458360 [compost metagenome]